MQEQQQQAFDTRRPEAGLEWLSQAGIRRVETVFPDLAGLARGKVLSAELFRSSPGARMPAFLLGVTVTGAEPPEVFTRIIPASLPDMALVPDWSTLVADPLAAVPTASLICDLAGRFVAADGAAEVDVAALAPRARLREELARLGALGLRARVAPELEFFLVHDQRDAAGRLRAAQGMSGSVPWVEEVHDLASAEALQSFGPFFDALWSACEAQRIPICGYGHESAMGQYEVNFMPGEPLAMADAVFRFKRLARELARRHGCHATFMAKPYADEPGTGMHWHVSLVDADGRNVFSDGAGGEHASLGHFVAGWQASVQAATALFAPYAHSFERLRRPDAAPASAHWGHDDRTVAFRVPRSDADNRRLEHRLPGGDANPYLILAMMLGAGRIGLRDRLVALPPRAPGSTPPDDGAPLPTDQEAAITALERCRIAAEVLGEPFVALYAMVKRHELAAQRAEPDFALRHLLGRS